MSGVTHIHDPSGRGVPLARRMIAFDRLRFAITIAGIGCAVVLMLFLLALYNGVRVESNGYIAERPAQAWVAQDNTTNFIKSSSWVRASAGDALRAVSGVAEVSPILRLITTVDIGVQRTTAIVLGIEPRSTLGRPQVVDGVDTLARGELILDRALARRYGAQVGDTLQVQGRPFRLVGLSRGTNAILTQLAFIPLDDARDLLGFRDVASFFLVRGTPSVATDALVDALRGRVAHTNVFSQETFAATNMDELRGGLLPILATVAVLGGTVALAVLTLLLYGTMLERREAYAVLKAIGAADGYLTRLIVTQAMVAVLGGLAFGATAYAICAPITVRLVPVMALAIPWPALGMVAVAVVALGAVGALLPLRRVARIHPAELFRA